MAFFDSAEKIRTGRMSEVNPGKLPSTAAGLGFDLFGLHGAYVDQTEALFGGLGQYVMFEHVPTGVQVFFKAFVTQFSDDYASTWTPHTGYGRMDDVQNFQKTSRSIQIGLKVVAGSVEEAKHNLATVSTFAQMLYPTFENSSGAQTIKAAPLLKLKFMNWAQNVYGGGLLGACRGFKFAPTMEAGVFETTRGKGVSKTNLIYPKVFTIDTSMQIIHQHSLGWKKSKTSPADMFASGEPKTGTYKASVVTWFQPQAERWPYGERVMDSPRSQGKTTVTNPDSDVAAKGEITDDQKKNLAANKGSMQTRKPKSPTARTMAPDAGPSAADVHHALTTDRAAPAMGPMERQAISGGSLYGGQSGLITDVRGHDQST